MTANIRKAVFPVAGLGTRFLPATKATPKEMLPIVDKPLIQYAVEEAVAAGAKILIFITGRNKRAIPDHFDRAYELEAELEAKGKQALLDTVRGIVPPSVTCVYIRQNQTLGLGHAVLCARPVVGDEPFYVVLADDLIDAERSCVDQMRTVHERTGGCVLAVEDVPRADTGRYGIVDVERFEDGSGRVTGIVEKPAPEAAPSTLGVVGRYVLTPAIFERLASTPKGAGGEIQLTDAIAALLADEPVHAYRFEGTRFDCGDKLGYLQATVVLGRRHPEIGATFSHWLKS